MIMLWLFLILLLWAGNSLLRDAVGIAERRGSSVWASARPEVGGAIIFYLFALIVAVLIGA